MNELFTNEVFTTADLVSFGNYLLSNERRELYKANPNYPNEERLEERLSLVDDSDLANWKEKN